VRVVLKRTVVGFGYLKATVTNNSSFQNYSHPDDHNIKKELIGFGE